MEELLPVFEREGVRLVLEPHPDDVLFPFGQVGLLFGFHSISLTSRKASKSDSTAVSVSSNAPGTHGVLRRGMPFAHSVGIRLE